MTIVECIREANNIIVCFSVAVTKGDIIIGHLQRNVS